MQTTTPTPTVPVAAGLTAGYLRISVDDTRREKRGGRSDADALNAAIERQREDCTDAVARYEGWPLDVSWYPDRDVSAFDEAVTRPEFERLLSDIEARRVSHVVVYHPDRLARQPLDLERFLRVMKRTGARFATALREYDLTDDGQVSMLRLEILMASNQSSASSRRVARAHRSFAKAGKPVGGARPFGWNDDKRTLHPTEAAIVREAFERVNAGEALHTIAANFNERGLRTPRGSIFRRSTLIEVLTNPRQAGMRTHRGEIVMDEHGEPVRGQWDTIVSREEWEKACARLTPRSERGNRASPPGGRGRKYLLSPFLRCGECGGRMGGMVRPNGTHSYSCAARGDGGCGGVSRNGNRLDADVLAAYFAHLAEAPAFPVAVEPFDGEEEMAAITANLAEARQASALGRLSFVDFVEIKDIAEARLSELRKARDAYAAALTAAEAASSAPTPEEFDRLTLAQKQEALGQAIAIVRVMKDDRRGALGYRPELAEIIWRE